MIIHPGALSLDQLRQVWREFSPIELDGSAWPGIEKSAATVQRIVEKGEPAYGINTGFGKLAKTQISRENLALLQENLVKSHAVGVGALLPEATVRLILFLKIASLARGFSGVRPEVIRTAIEVFNAQVWPVIPSQGSVGASGDLAPLAHLTLGLMDEGLRAKGVEPIWLEAKEGLALLNGTQVSAGIALAALFQAEAVYGAAVVAGALSVDAAMGSDAPFDPRIHEVRGQAGQIEIAGRYRDLLRGSQIRESHRVDDDRVQDPYCLRCQPQVMGACLDAIRSAARVLLVEANAVTDNPLVFGDEVVSGGNFHAEPVGIAADHLAIAMAEVGAISERRIALLTDASFSLLPPFLVAEAGLNSGFMIAHVTAAALASENKTLAHPATVDSLPTSANQEDHVSMATFAARKLVDLVANVRRIVAIELLAAAQGIDFRRPLRSSNQLEDTYNSIRALVKFYDQDRYMAPDIEAIADLIADGAFAPHCPALLEPK